jgi:hypothetical protein
LWTPTPLVKKHFFGIMFGVYNMKINLSQQFGMFGRLKVGYK